LRLRRKPPVCSPGTAVGAAEQVGAARLPDRLAVDAQIERPSATPRVALVTGGAGGLAQGICLALARAGYRVAFTFRDGGTPPDATLDLVRPLDPDVVAIGEDLAEFEAAGRAVEEARRRRGPVEVLVHAVGPIAVMPFERSGLDDYRRMIEGNLGSAVALAFAALPNMRARGFGRLVFFGMNGSHVTQPARLMSLYGAAKAAVVTFARTLALEEAKYGITVNVIEPGDIRDKLAGRRTARGRAANNPTGRPGSWEDVAAAVCFAIGDEAFYLNGMVLGVNGGLVEPHE
jgi:NAD(P)-dependent dehydrogenase (short-subunit alcohol dehydrogenase family)